MNLEIEKSGPICVAKVSGEINLGDEERLATELQELVVEAQTRLAIDLSGLNHINSSALTELINVVVRARMHRSRVVLVAPTAFIMGVFEVTRLEQWFEIVADLAAARAALAN